MRKNLFVILPVLLVLSFSSSCAVGLKQEDRKLVLKMNEHLKGVQEELHILNQNLAGIKELNQNTTVLTIVMTGVQNELNILNQTLSGFLKFKNPLSP